MPYRCFVAGNGSGVRPVDQFSGGALVDSICRILPPVPVPARPIAAEGCGSTVTGSKSLKIWIAYANPSSANGEALKAGSLTVPTSEPAANNLTLTFDADGVAPLPLLNYDDAGQLTLYAVDDRRRDA